MSGRKPLYLARRGPVYYLRLPLPVDLIARLKRRELTKSLRTTELKIAKPYALVATYRFQILCDSVRKMKDLRDEQIRQVIREFWIKLIQDVEIEQAENDYDLQLLERGDDFVANELSEMEWNRIPKSPQIKSDAQMLIECGPWDPTTITKLEMDAIRDGVIRARREAIHYRSFRRSNLLDEYVPMDSLFKAKEAIAWSKTSGSPPKTKKFNRADSLRNSIDEYLKDIAASCTAQTLAEKHAPLNWFAGLIGEKSSVKDITDQHILKYRELVRKLEKNADNSQQLADCITNDPKRQVHPKTAQKKFHTVMTFLRWVRNLGRITVVPGEHLKFPIKIAKKNYSIRSFTTQELNSLFSSPLFSGCKSKTIRHVPGKLVSMDDPYWILLVLAHTGMRLNEVLQLASTYIVLDVSHPFIRLDGSKMDLKNAASDRSVPIHPNLVDFGFINFVRRRKKDQPNAFLFDQSVSNGKLSNYYSQKFGRYFDRVKLDDRKLKTHSLRHTFVDALRNAQVPDSGLKQIIGHQDQSVTNQYGSGASQDVLAKYVSSVDLGFEANLVDRLKKNASKYLSFKE